ncbi:MAG TPA: diaminopimelate epimerase [Cyclobacteriaceae bacterium]|nr:diaminopimelate epimerase [Cyclobacteriaceae bacterium]
MKFHFYKYQATGNDFVLVDNQSGQLSFTKSQIQRICNRKFGIGADGLILIEKDRASNFNVNYYNSDGSQSLCGNGSRAAVQFASSLGLINGKAHFSAYDGLHDAEILPAGIVRLRMNNVEKVERKGEDFIINTGSPHYIRFVDNIEAFPVYDEGRKVRYSNAFQENGINVNFVQVLPDNRIFVRTYERGVEDETLSCGTGITAAALAASFKGYSSPVTVKALGGDLSVEFKSGGVTARFTDIFLVGPAKMVFEGDLEL